MIIKKFKDYILESRVYFLNDLNSKLISLSNDGDYWAKKILDSEGKYLSTDTTFLNLNGDKFSFSKESDVKSKYSVLVDDLFKEDFPVDIEKLRNLIWWNSISNLSNRGIVKMGKIIKKIVPDIPDKDLELLVNKLKSETSDYEIKIISGDKITYYYQSDSCDKSLLKYGTLKNSCMMDKNIKNIFDIYTKNPDVCKLLIMVNSDDELVARSLIWKIDEVNDEKVNDVYFMDRVYFTKDWMVEKINHWAKDNKIIIKSDNKDLKDKMTVKIKSISYRKFPYLDTFYFYDIKKSILSNKELNRGFNLQSTSGDYYSKGTNLEVAMDRSRNYIRRFKELF